MARRSAVLGRGFSVCEQLGVAAICRCFGQAQIRSALEATGCRSHRHRDLPAEMTMYDVIAMALFRHVNLREVLRCLLEGIRRLHGDLPVKITGKSGISQARSRLGFEPLQHLYERAVQPIATKATLGAWYRGWRLVSLDGRPWICRTRRR